MLIKKSFFRILLFLLAHLPFSLVYLFSNLLSLLLYLIPNSHKTNTNINLKIAFPLLNKTERAIFLRKSLKATAKSLFETGVVWLNFRKLERNNLLKIEGIANIKKSINLGKGLILFTPHMGNIELVLSFLAKKFSCTILYSEAKIGFLDSVMLSARKKTGAKMVKANPAGLKKILKALRENKVIAMAPDQVPNKKGGLLSNFFGHPALTMTLISNMASKTNSPCHSVTCVRLNEGAGFKILFSKRIEPLNTLGLQEGVNLMNCELEKCIMRAPEQYAWEYKKYKHSNSKDIYG